MQTSVSIDIGIREIRMLTGFIKTTHGVDYSEYALTSFKRCIEGFLTRNRYSLDVLMQKLESKEFMDHFAGQLAAGTTELFRDPTFWILLKNNYLANILKEQTRARVWLPMCASGEEFYSLSILLKEVGWTNRVDVYVSSISNESLDAIKKGWMKQEKLEISTKNYIRFQGAGQLTDYFKTTGGDIFFDKALFANAHFLQEGLDFRNNIPPMHLILFRNQMIYFNPSLQYRLCDALHGRLTERGLLALGILEEIELNINSKYTALNKGESIYQRKN